MRFLILALTAAVAVSARPQNTASSSASTITSSPSSALASLMASSSTSNQPATHTVAVAKGGHTFVPDVIQAAQGDVIEFQFYPTNHSVVRAAYGYPCVPYEMVEGGKPGFFSGFQPVDAVLDNPPSWNLQINDTEPIFFYCSQVNSCIGYEMVGVVNPNSSVSLQHQKDLAGQSSFMLSPGQDWPSEGSIPSGIATTSSAPAATSASSSTSSSTTSTSTSSGHSGPGIGAIVGIAVVAAAILIISGIGCCWFQRRSRRNQELALEHQIQRQNMTMHNAAREFAPISPMTTMFSPVSAHFAQIHPDQHKTVSMVTSYPVNPGYGGTVGPIPQSPPPIPHYQPQQFHTVDPLMVNRDVNGNSPDHATPMYTQAAPAYAPLPIGGSPNMYTSPAPQVQLIHSLPPQLQVHEMPGCGQTASPISHTSEMSLASDSVTPSLPSVHPAKREMVMRSENSSSAGSGRRRSIEKFEY